MKIILLIFSILFTAATSEPVKSTPPNRCEGLSRAGFLFLKDFNIKATRDGYFEYSYVLTKGTTYAFASCFPEAGQKSVVTDLTLYNDGRKVMFEKALRYPGESVVFYQCLTTGIYYVRMESKDPAFNSGVSIMSFQKK